LRLALNKNPSVLLVPSSMQHHTGWLVMGRCGGKSGLAGVSVADMRYIRAAAQFHMMNIA